MKPSIARDCHSDIGVHLKPILPNLQWAVETSASIGQMSGSGIDRRLNTESLFWALDYNLKKFEIYLEGGAKYWQKSDDGPGLGAIVSGWESLPKPEQRNFGMREAYTRLTLFNNRMTMGLQSMTLGTTMLLDERVLGISNSYEKGHYKFELKGGTVSTDFARMNDFCGTRHVYRLLRGGRFDMVATEPWKTNFYAASITWNAEEPVEVVSGDQSEFEMESFSDFSFESFDEEETHIVQNAGLLFYQEFGSGFFDYKYYGGAFSDILLPFDVDLHLEMIYQYIWHEQAAAFKGQFSKNFNIFPAYPFSTSLSYYGVYEVSQDARFFPAFSNLYLGEVSRLDALHMPLLVVDVKQYLPGKLEPALRLQYVNQIQFDHNTELDFQLSAKLFKGLRTIIMLSKIDSDLLSESVMLNKLECRWSF